MVEEYVTDKRLRELLQEQLVDILREKPDDLLGFLENWARERRAGSTNRSPVASIAPLPPAIASSFQAAPSATAETARGRRSSSSVPPPLVSKQQRRLSDNSSVTSMHSGGSFGAKSIHEICPLSPYGNRGSAPSLEKASLLSPPSHVIPDSLLLEGSMTVGEGDIVVTMDDEGGSPRIGADFGNLGVSVMTPRSRNRSVISNSESLTTNGGGAGNKDDGDAHDGVVFVQCDAAAPLPLRMPDSHHAHVRIDEHYSNFVRLSPDRINAKRRDGLPVSLKLKDLAEWSKVDIDEALREVYSIINVSIQHTGFVHILDAFIESQSGSTVPVLYIVQAFLERPMTLKKFVEQHGLLREQQARHVLKQLVDALHFTHFHGQPHHRITAENVFVTGLHDDGLEVRIGIFGLEPCAKRNGAEFSEDIRQCGELMQEVVDPGALTGRFGEIVDSMCDVDEQLATAAILAALDSKSALQVLDDTGIPLVATDENGVITSWNGPAAMLFEYDVAEAIGQNITLLMRGTVKDEHPRLMQEYREKRVKRKLDDTTLVTCFAKSGRQISVEMRVTEHPEDHEFLAIFRDVSPVLSIQVHNRLLVWGACIVEYIPIACVAVDAATKSIVSYNRSAAELFGHLPAQVIGKPLKMLAPPDKHFQQCLVDFDFSGPRNVLCREQSGAIFTTRLYSFQVDVDVGGGATADDNSSIRETGVAAPSAEAVVYNYYIPENSITNDFNSLFTTIADSLLTAVIIIDEYGMIKRLSRFAEEIFEWGEREALGKNVRILMEKRFADKHQSYIERFKKSGVSDTLGRPKPMYGLTKSGKRVKIRICVQPYYRHSLLWFVAFVTPLADDVVHRQPTPVSSSGGGGLQQQQQQRRVESSGNISDQPGHHGHDASRRSLTPGTAAAFNALGPSASGAAFGGSFSGSETDGSDADSEHGGPMRLRVTREHQDGEGDDDSSESLEPPNRLSPMRRRTSNLGSFLPSSPSTGGTTHSVRFELDPGALH